MAALAAKRERQNTASVRCQARGRLGPGRMVGLVCYRFHRGGSGGAHDGRLLPPAPGRGPRRRTTPCPSCSATLQVEGCDADMQELRPFYQRLRICGEPGQQQLRSRCAMGTPGHKWPSAPPAAACLVALLAACPAHPCAGRLNVCRPYATLPLSTRHQQPACVALCLAHPPSEAHAKAHSITDTSGRVMRFCQQCSKLQPIRMFEGGHRSCAASLDRREPGHLDGCAALPD